MMFDSTKYIELTCGDCVVRVGVWHPFNGDPGTLDVQVVSNEQTRWNMMFSRRLKNAWKVLRGNYDWSGFQIDSKDDATALATAITAASDEAFPSRPIIGLQH